MRKLLTLLLVFMLCCGFYPGSMYIDAVARRWAGAGASVSSGLDYLQSAENVTNLTTYTFSSQNLGDAVTGRYIIVGVNGRNAGTTARTINSVTVGGQAGTVVKQYTNTGDGNMQIDGLAIVGIDSGTTGDIVVTYSGSMYRCQISVYRAYGIDSATPTDTYSDNSTNPSVSIDVSANGFAVGMAGTGSSVATTTWSGLTEYVDAHSAEAGSYTSAAKTFENAQSGLTVQTTFSSNSAEVLVVAAWAFA